MLATQAPHSSPAPPSSDERDRAAYNAAFTELELGWQWDARTYRDLMEMPDERSRICTYIRRYHPHLLRAYEADFLAELIQQTKRRCEQEMTVLT